MRAGAAGQFVVMRSGQAARWLAACAACATVFALGACITPPAMSNVDGATFTATATSDVVTVSVDQGAPAVVHVHDTRGIGGLTLTATGTVTTPTHVRLYLTGLEGVEIRFGDVVITGHGSQGGHVASAVSVDAGRADLPTITAHTAAGADATTTPLVDGYFEISLPTGYFNTRDQSVTLAWVDFYR